MLKSMRKSKNRNFYHIFVSPGDDPGAITLNLYGWKGNSMLTNCLAACVDLSITVSEIQRDIREKIGNLVFDAPVRGVRIGISVPLWYGKTRMVSLPDAEKISIISSFVLAQLTNVTDRRTPGDSIYRAYAYTSRGKNCINNVKVNIAAQLRQKI